MAGDLTPIRGALRLRRLLREIRRRRVWQVAGAYAVVAWLVVEIVLTSLDVLGFPHWTSTLVLVAAFAGLPVAIVLSWVFDLTPGGVRRTPPLPVSPPLPALPVVAVLPFEAAGAGQSAGWLADGLTEDVTTQLTKLGRLRVISRASTMRIGARADSTREIALLLGATAVVTGSVREHGGRVRITANLVDAASDQHLWADSYEQSLDDLFGLQSELSLRIARALRAEITAEERSRLARPATADLEAQRAYLSGRARLFDMTEDALKSAIHHLRRAVELDPSFATAHADTAFAYALLGMGFGAGGLTPQEAFACAWREAEAAVRIDPGLGRAHSVLALLNFQSRFDWEAAERECRTAIELSPGEGFGHAVYGLCLSAQGRYEEAIREQTLTLQLDPLTPTSWSDLATTFLRAGRYAEAQRLARRLLELEPGFLMAHTTLAWSLILSGDVADGMAELEYAVLLAPENVKFRAQLGQARAMTADTAGAREVLADLEALRRHRHVSPYHLAYVYTGLGLLDDALDLLEQAYSERSGGIYGVGGSFLFAPLRDHPRFRRLLARMNLHPLDELPSPANGGKPAAADQPAPIA